MRKTLADVIRDMEKNGLEAEAEVYFRWREEQKKLKTKEKGEKGGVHSVLISRKEDGADVFNIKDENNHKYAGGVDLNRWEWIGAHCQRLGWALAARIAGFLGVLERQRWGSQHRTKWLDNYRYYDEYMYNVSYKTAFLVAVSRHRDFKMGCFVSGYECKYCLIAEKQGACDQKGSLPFLWEFVLEQESGEVPDEEWEALTEKALVRIGLK